MDGSIAIWIAGAVYLTIMVGGFAFLFWASEKKHELRRQSRNRRCDMVMIRLLMEGKE